MGTNPTPTPAPPGLGPGTQGPTGSLAPAGAWNLGFKLSNQSQTLALLAAGSIIGGLVGVGVLVTAVATTVIGQALADFGLSAEVGRVSVAYPSRRTVTRCYRAIALHAPLAFVVAPALYAAVGPTTPSVGFLAVIGVASALLVATAALTALLNGLGDFRSPALGLGSARALSGIAAIAGAAIDPSPTIVLGTFAIGESVGLSALAWSVRKARAGLPEGDDLPDARLKRGRAWLGAP